MAKTENRRVEDSFVTTCSSIISGTITFFLFMLVTIFPLIYHRGYADILETKYWTYCVIAIGMAVVVGILALIMLLIDKKENSGIYSGELFSALKPRNWKKTFSLADAGVIVFWVFAGISTLQSEWLYEAFWGNEGRYSGFFLITIYVVFYFIVSRYWNVKNWILETFLASGMILCLIGITDYFQLDVLNFRGNMRPEQSTIFTSTIGNINTYTAYVAIVMGVAAGGFAAAKGKIQTIWYYVCMTVAFFAIIMGCSDNAYLALGAMFAFLPFVMFSTKKGILRYGIMAATFVTVIQCIDWMNQAFADMVIGLDSLFGILAGFSGLPAAVCGLWVIVGAVYFWCRRETENEEKICGYLVKAWGIFAAAAILAVFGMVFDANVNGNGARYGALEKYLVFSDSWGTDRGYIWRKSLEVYQEFPILHKLFGYGPDTFGILATRGFMGDMLEKTGLVFDTAHNEYIQYLLTIGPIALLGYLVFLIGSCGSMVKVYRKNPYILACATAVLCYGVQAIVNLNLPIVTPMMWFWLSVGISLVRRNRECQR